MGPFPKCVWASSRCCSPRGNTCHQKIFPSEWVHFPSVCGPAPDVVPARGNTCHQKIFPSEWVHFPSVCGPAPDVVPARGNTCHQKVFPSVWVHFPSEWVHFPCLRNHPTKHIRRKLLSEILKERHVPSKSVTPKSYNQSELRDHARKHSRKCARKLCNEDYARENMQGQVRK